MLDSFLNVAYVNETREQTEREAVALLKQLPAEDLLKIASGAKVAWLDCPPGGTATSFLDKFRGSPLFEEAMALEQEELQAEMTNLERRKEQRSTQQLEQGLWDMQDQLRIKKRLLELRLAQEEAGGMGAQAGGGAPPPLNAPVVPEAGAQGAGAVGSESTPVDANKTASNRESAEEPSAGRGKAFVQSLGDGMGHGAGIGGAIGAVAGATHGAMGGGGLKDRVLRALGHGAVGMGTGALAGGLGAGLGGAPGAAVGAMTANPFVGAVGGAGAGYGVAKRLLPREYADLAPAAAMLSGAGGLTAGIRAQRSGKAYDAHKDAQLEKALGLHKKTAHALDLTVEGWGRELARGDFAKAAVAVAIESAAKEAGIVLAKQGAALGGGLGALGTMATNFIRNPANAKTVMGAGAGALGGLSSGLQKDEHGQRHLLGGLAKGVAGGALGGLAGHAAQNIGTSLASGTQLAPAIKQYGAGWAGKIRDVAGAMKPPVQIAA